MYRINFSEQHKLSSRSNKRRVEGISRVGSHHGSRIMMCARQGHELIGYEYVARTDDWMIRWNETVFNQDGEHSISQYPWLVLDNLLENGDVIMIRVSDGIRFYQMNRSQSKLNFLSRDGNFHQVFGWRDMLFGNFYSNNELGGVMTRQFNGNLRFYAAVQESFLPNERNPLFLLNNDQSLTNDWRIANIDFFLTNLLHQDQSVIGLRTVNGLEFYQFDANNDLRMILQTLQFSISNDDDRLFFGDFTNQIYQDILHFNTSGLYVYKYDENHLDYVNLHHNVEFSRQRGWLSNYFNFIKIADLNLDGRDDLIFTGARGLTALTFDVDNNDWKMLIDPANLNGRERFATVVGVLPPIPPKINELSVFAQDTDGTIHWGRFSQLPISTTTVSVPVVTDPTNIPEDWNDNLIPEKVSRISLGEKPILRVSEQWENNLQNNMVDTASGQVRFKIPIIDISASTMWNLRFDLVYHSEAPESVLLGEGWSIPITQEFIYVDHRGSIFPLDFHYFLVLNGDPQRLQVLSYENGKMRFQMNESPELTDESLMKIEYYPSDERWIIESSNEKVIYGKANCKEAKDAFQWSLEFPNWRGQGNNKELLKPLVTSWFVNSRETKFSNSILFYDYEFDEVEFAPGIFYTYSLRLETIRDDDELCIDFNYGSKMSTEYSSPNPVDENGNIAFPVSLAQSHFLQGFDITTVEYRQNFKLIYQMNGGKRLLTSIEQSSMTSQETVLKFSYENIQDQFFLKSCSLSTGVEVNFKFEQLKLPSMQSSNFIGINFPARERPRIAQGSDFTVYAYRNMNNSNGKVILNVLDRRMTNIKVDCRVDRKFLCPEMESSIENFSLHTFPDAFVILMENEHKFQLNFFKRADEVWSSEPNVQSFSKDVSIKINDCLIVVANLITNDLILFERDLIKSTWTKKFIPINSNRRLTRIALHNRIIVGYDDYQLWIVSRDLNSRWDRRILDSNLGNFNNVLDRFDLKEDYLSKFTKIFDQNGLQVFNNFIVFNALEENNGQLTSRVWLYLLDQDCNPIRKQLFSIQQENIYKLSLELEDDGSSFFLGYRMENGRFRMRVTRISGLITEDIDRIRNRNQREDAMNARLNKINNDENFIKMFTTNILIDFNSYFIGMHLKGAQIGKKLLQMTGRDWKLTDLPPNSNLLGDHFILESDDNLTIKLYAQNSKNSRRGSPLRVFNLYQPGQLINRYPIYIAYQSSIDLVRVVFFKNEKTLGSTRTFKNEQIMFESDWENLITFSNVTDVSITHTEPHECKVRPLVSLISPDEPQSFITQMEVSDGKLHRLTGYEHTFNYDDVTATLTETSIVIPTGNRENSGWYESTRYLQILNGNVTENEKYFHADGSRVLAPPKISAWDEKVTEIKPNPSLLLDIKEELLISDISPYKLSDESMVFYGFESYEKNQIGDSKSSENKWNFVNSKVVENNFSFTGQNYLELNENSYLEGTLSPRYQNMTYVASCWLKSNKALKLDDTISNLKAIITTLSGHKIMGILSQVKRQLEDWSYLEIQIDFNLIKQKFLDYYTTSADPISINDVKFKVKLKVAPEQGEVIDLDHIRFCPLSHDIHVNVYNSITGKHTAVIQGNSLVTRALHDRFQQQIGSIQKDGELESFSSQSRTGKVIPNLKTSNIVNKPSILTFNPEKGFHETFDSYAFRHRWQIDNKDSWNIARGQLWHRKSQRNRILAHNNLFDNSSAAFRCYFSLQKIRASLSFHWKELGDLNLTRQSKNSTVLKLFNNKSLVPLPFSGELIVMIEKNSIFIWFDGVLIVDQEISTSSPWNEFYFEVQGQILVEDFLVMNNPRLKIEYSNAFGEKTQIIKFVDENNIQVIEKLYDEHGREAIVTKSTHVVRTKGKPLLSYRPNFATNKNPSNVSSVWHTGKLEGEVDRLNPDDEGVPFYQTEFSKNPLNERSAIGLAGSSFSINGNYATRLSLNSNIALLENLFPRNEGYLQSVKFNPNKSVTVTVLDKNRNQVARYIKVPGFNHLLSTYEYNKENRLTKILPPLYHEKVRTASRINLKSMNRSTPTLEEMKWQKLLGTFYFYDEYGNLIRRISPDNGRTDYLYDRAGNRRFMFSVNDNNQTSSIIYYDYNINGHLIETGFLKKSLSIELLRRHIDVMVLPDHTEEFQRIDYYVDHPDPSSRERVRNIITNVMDNPVIDEFQFNSQDQIVSKAMISTLGSSENLFKFTKKYIRNEVHKISYPFTLNGKQLNLIHRYNRIGQLTELGVENELFAQFTYNVNGLLENEIFQPNTRHEFKRKFHYNSPGFLLQISDPFLTQEIAYTDTGYGQTGNGDGIIMQTTFNATWPNNSDGRWFQLSDLGGNFSEGCRRALIRTGYLTTYNQVTRLYVPELENSLPVVCNRRLMAESVARRQIPRFYGHSFAYGSHQELVKAKYFTDETFPHIDPLQPHLFSKISGLNMQQSLEIWSLLTSSRFIINDQQLYDAATAVGKPGRSLFRDMEMLSDLRSLSDRYIAYHSSIRQLISVSIINGRILTLEDFVESFLHWTSLSHFPNPEIAAEEIFNMLIKNKYLPTKSNSIHKVLNVQFTTVLAKYSRYIPKIVQIMLKRFAHVLGNTAFDAESYEIDANGNHKLFYTGFNRYEFSYRENSNQVERVHVGVASDPKRSFAMKHDQQGNVIQALHCSIDTIEYHPVSQRTTHVKMTDGRVLRFSYNAQGERVLKRVYSANGRMTHETLYFRDEKGQVLVDKQFTYSLFKPVQKIVTAYLYGSRGLLGFIRNDKFYSVMTDHAGSIRLVIRDNQVVAAYDYLPYGEIMRAFGNDPEAQIVYRFTGQEYDEETGLYNYRARLYDPKIGRFYQIDPQLQYFNPYKYAGNSPISLVDPDGEFAFLISVIVGAFVGMYLGGAAANGRWNPANWDWSDRGTWLGMLRGGLTGALLPFGVVGSVAIIGSVSTIMMGVGVAYLTAASANGNFAPWRWDWRSPNTFNALFIGC